MLPIAAGDDAIAAFENDGGCMAEGCTNGAWMRSIVWQQFRALVFPCGGQGMLWQHCMACSGVCMAEQSNVYAPSAATRMSIIAVLAYGVIAALAVMPRMSSSTVKPLLSQVKRPRSRVVASFCNFRPPRTFAEL